MQASISSMGNDSSVPSALCCWILVEDQAVAVVLLLVEAYHDHRMPILPIHELAAKMDTLECKSASIASTPPGGLDIVGPKSPTTCIPSNFTLDWLSSSWLIRCCLLAHLVDMPVDIQSSTSGVEATTIVPINGSKSSLQLWHLMPSLCWWACSINMGWQWLWYISQVLFNPGKPLVTAMAPLFSMMTTTVGSRKSRQWCQVLVGGVATC